MESNKYALFVLCLIETDESINHQKILTRHKIFNSAIAPTSKRIFNKVKYGVLYKTNIAIKIDNIF